MKVNTKVNTLAAVLLMFSTVAQAQTFQDIAYGKHTEDISVRFDDKIGTCRIESNGSAGWPWKKRYIEHNGLKYITHYSCILSGMLLGEDVKVYIYMRIKTKEVDTIALEFQSLKEAEIEHILKLLSAKLGQHKETIIPPTEVEKELRLWVFPSGNIVEIVKKPSGSSFYELCLFFGHKDKWQNFEKDVRELEGAAF